MLNPVLSNVEIMIGDNFFDSNIIKKYDDFLFKRNHPLKNFYAFFHEGIQSITFPGFNMPTIDIDSLNNTRLSEPGTENFIHPVSHRTMAGDEPYENMLTSKTFTLTMKNMILNYMYIFEWMYNYYKRRRDKKMFDVVITMLDSTDLPLLRYIYRDCFAYSLPELEFSFNETFDESKTIDVGFVYNNIDANLIIPDYTSTKLNF